MQITIFKQAGKYRNFFNQISAVEKKISLWHAFCKDKVYSIDIQQIEKNTHLTSMENTLHKTIIYSSTHLLTTNY